MGYTAYLTRLLSPLGVYDLREGSISGACVAALGEAMDEVATELDTALRESIISTAQDAGLQLWEQALALPPAQDSVEARRAALQSLLCTEPVHCSGLQILRQLQACGIDVMLSATNQTVTVRCSPVPAVGSPERRLIEALMPAHLAVTYTTRA